MCQFPRFSEGLFKKTCRTKGKDIISWPYTTLRGTFLFGIHDVSRSCRRQDLPCLKNNMGESRDFLAVGSDQVAHAEVRQVGSSPAQAAVPLEYPLPTCTATWEFCRSCRAVEFPNCQIPVAVSSDAVAMRSGGRSMASSFRSGNCNRMHMGTGFRCRSCHPHRYGCALVATFKPRSGYGVFLSRGSAGHSR